MKCPLEVVEMKSRVVAVAVIEKGASVIRRRWYDELL